MLAAKRYIGDGCYVEFNGADIVLTTSDGIRVTNRIVLERAVWQALDDFVRQIGYHIIVRDDDDGA